MFDPFSPTSKTPDPTTDETASTLDGDFHNTSSPSSTTRISKPVFARSGETPNSIRWVRRILAILILLCLAMAVWVWADILHGLP